MSDLKKLAFEFLRGQNFSFLATSVIDFKTQHFDAFCLKQQGREIQAQDDHRVIFDLASLTKPLSLGLFWLIYGKDKLPDTFQLLLDHRGGLPSWGLLSSVDWKEQLASYCVQESETCYSDFSALRLMLEIEKNYQKAFESLVKQDWRGQLSFWKNLEKKEGFIFPCTGVRGGRQIRGEVHDPNAFNLNQFCTHAGLFSDINSLSETLLHFNNKFDLIRVMRKGLQEKKTRFLHAWDTPCGETTLAGNKCSQLTFGHLGFTGTSIWIDCEKELGHIILTNATEKYWYERKGLQKLRRGLANEVWSTR